MRQAVNTNWNHRIWRAVIVGSILFLVLYAPIETWVSRHDLTSPGYICDLIAFLLLAYGCYEAIRQLPNISVAPLCAAWGYCAALFWRCYFMRVFDRQRNLGIYEAQPSWVEPVLLLMLVIAFLAVGVCLYLDRASKNDGKSDGIP
jgi:hypothetical protein